MKTLPKKKPAFSGERYDEAERKRLLVLNEVRQAAGPVSRAELVVATGMTSYQVANALSALVTDGRLKRISRLHDRSKSVWSLPD